MLATETEVNVKDVRLDKILRTVADCVEMFIHARDEGRIQFGPDLITHGTEKIAWALVLAVQSPGAAQHLIGHSASRCAAMIAAIENRPDTNLRIEDLVRLFDSLKIFAPSPV